MTRAHALLVAPLLSSCGGDPSVKTVNVERTSTTTVAIPKATVCPKPDEMPALPAVVVAPEGAATDQLAAASAANAEAFARYSMAVSAMFKRCADGVSK